MISLLGKIPFSFTADLWQFSGPSGWVFVNVPKPMSNEIRRHFKKEEQGWGRLSIIAQINSTTWTTAIWYDSHHLSYLLPLKSEIRKKEKLSIGQNIEVTIFI
jgi:Domain of unknown function (DUF1905)